jgi:hypothetical protein
MDSETSSAKTRPYCSPFCKNREGEVGLLTLFIGAKSLVDRSGALLSQREHWFLA